MIKGLIGKKLGMTQTFREDGRAEATTIVEAGPCIVVQVKTEDKEGYSAVQLGYGEAKRLKSPQKGHFKELGSFRYLKEIRVKNTKDISVGDKVDVGLFKMGDMVDITGISKGRGFAGVVKRHGFAGGPKTHGQSDRHRAPGSIGAGTSPGRVLKGTKMGGHMGCVKVTVAKLEVIGADPEKNILMIKGAVPGCRNGLLMIRKSGK
jgi:large subunit ribosomal protein L3